MASAKNKVLSGDYVDDNVRIEGLGTRLVFGYGKEDNPFTSTTHITLDKSTVESYEVLTEDKVKSASSTMLRAGAGALLLGPVGLLAGVSGKTKGIYNVAILFKNGKKSLIEIDDAHYKVLMKVLF